MNKLKLRLPISQKLQNAKPIRSDTAAGKVNIEKVNKQLNDFDFDMIDNSNLSRAHLNGRGLLAPKQQGYVTVFKKSD